MEVRAAAGCGRLAEKARRKDGQESCGIEIDESEKQAATHFYAREEGIQEAEEQGSLGLSKVSELHSPTAKIKNL